MSSLLVIGIHDGWTQILHCCKHKKEDFRVLEQRCLPNQLALSLSRHGHLRPEAIKALLGQILPLNAEFHKKVDGIRCLIGSAVVECPAASEGLQKLVLALAPNLRHAPLLLNPFSESRLLMKAWLEWTHQDNGTYIIQPGGWDTLATVDLGRSFSARMLQLGSERPAVMDESATVFEEGLESLNQLLRGHLKVLQVTGVPAWLIGTQLRRMSFLDADMLWECNPGVEDLKELEKRLNGLDGAQRGMLPMLEGNGHMLRDALAIIQAIMQKRGFQKLHIFPWNAVHGMALELL